MIGDKLVIDDTHRAHGTRIADAAQKLLGQGRTLVVVTVAGESGSGKSETAAATAAELERRGHPSLILAQDDYFKLPPKSNARKRQDDISWVGPQEVRLDLLEEQIKVVRTGANELTKPLVYFDKDTIGEETLTVTGIQALIIEGTYTTLLADVDLHAFIDTTFENTLEHRRRRARDDTESAFIQNVLRIEHEIISKQKERADLVLQRSGDECP